MRLLTVRFRLRVACAILLGCTLALATRGEEPAATEKKLAVVVVRLPADAELFIGGFKSKSSGEVREFETPPLVPGKKFTYRIKAAWTDKGKEVLRETKAIVQAGETIEVNLLTLPMPDKKPEPEKKPEPVKKPEAVKKPEPEKKPEPKKPQPEKKPVPVKTPEPEKKPEPKKKLEPEKKTEPVKKPEPVKRPEPEKKPEPVKRLEPEKKPEPVKRPEPEKKPEPVKKLQPEKKPEPVKKSEPIPPAVKPIAPTAPLAPAVTPSKASFQLVMPEILSLQPGATKLLPIKVIRTDFKGPVTVKFGSLPSGVKIEEATIPAGKEKVYVEASATSEAAEQEGTVKVVGTAAGVHRDNVLTVKIVK